MPRIHRVSQIKAVTTEDIPLVLVGNKSDLTESRVITREQGVELAESLGMEYFEASVKDNVNITEAVDKLVDLILGLMQDKIPEEKPEEPNEPPITDTHKVVKPVSVPKKDGCSEGICNQGLLVFVGAACAILFGAYYFK